MVEGNIACGNGIDVHLIPLPGFVALASLYVRFIAVNIAKSLCGQEYDCVGSYTNFVALNNVRGASGRSEQPSEFLRAMRGASYRISDGTARSICGDHL